MTNDLPTSLGGAGRPEESSQVALVRGARRAAQRRRSLLEWIVAMVVAVLVAFGIKSWVAQTFVIPSGSMENTLLIGDRVLVSKLSYNFGAVERGDVIVFDNPECFQLEGGDFCQYAQLIKRVVGVSGDRVSASSGKLVVNGDVQPEAFLKPGSTTRMPGACAVYDEKEVITVAPGELLVMGDNRNMSKDGRCFGPIPATAVVGKAFLRLWPVGRIGGL